jgi:alpha-amylase
MSEDGVDAGVENGVMFQFFHWHTAPNGRLWDELAERAAELSRHGITGIWIPPCYKGAGGGNDRGYGVYDLFDLGEFDQKASVRTKYGDKAQLLRALQALREQRIRIYADLVFNQRTGGDETEEVEAKIVSDEDRNQELTPPLRIRAWTRFTFPGRGETYSSMKWSHEHFIATDCNADAPDERKIYLFADKTFSGDVSFEQGNFDFLMGCDVDTYHPQVFEELLHFGRWFAEQTGVDGFRLDALKHLPAGFYKEWLARMREHFGERELFAVGEYWSADLAELNAYLEKVDGGMKLFDVPLHFRFQAAAQGGSGFDLCSVLDGTLVQQSPLLAVTFVENHDTQPGGGLESSVDAWFKPLAYALILLRREGYPCVFYPDYYGHEGEGGALPSHRVLLDAFLEARAKYNYGDQHDYFDHPNCIAWLRTGDAEHPGAMVVVLSNGEAGHKRIETQKPDAEFHDCTGHDPEPIRTDAQGAAEFRCPAGSLSVWLQR